MTSEWTAIFQAGLPQIGALGPQRRMAAERGLWRLLAVQATRYTMGDSSSVALETAENLLESLCFTLGAYFDQGAEGPEALLRGGLNGLLERAQNALERKVEAGKALWKRACLSLPEVESVSLRDTLKGIGVFFDRYDWRFLAHEIPGYIDYPLCLPVPGEKKGIDYILAYLRRLNAESSLLRRFDPALAARLLQGCAPDFGELPLNLCEPVLACAVGLLLADTQAQTLNMTDRERGRLAELLSGGAREVRRMLAGAADELCRSLGVPEEDGAYLAAAAAELCPRILAALPAKRLENVFPSLGGV